MHNCFNGVYKGKKVLITGHTGFKGAWISIFLNELGANVLGYSLEPPTVPSLFDSAGLKDRVKHIIGDVRDEKKLLSVFHEFQPEFVFHMAAQPLVRMSYRETRLTYETNVMGTINVFEAVRKTDSVIVVVNITSDKCYENKEWLFGYRENDPMGGHDPYSSSKGCAELVSSAYRNSFFDTGKHGAHKVSLSSVRAGNVIGGGDWAEDRLIPDCMRYISQGKVIQIRYPNAVRPWQHVLEPLSGYLWLGTLMSENNNVYNSGWNFGPGDDAMLTVGEIVELILKYWGKGEFSADTSDHPHEATLLKLDCSKAHAILKWKYIYNIEESLRATVDWYKKYYHSEGNSDMYGFSVDQITNYVKQAKSKEVLWSLG